MTPVTYSHLTAGSTAIGPKGQVYRFMGKPGSTGEYTTTDKDAIKFLDEIAANPQTQLTRKTVAAGEEVVVKVVDPAIALAAEDAAAASARIESPEVKTAQEKLADLIAANKAA